jgi:hypothetical protein
MMGGSIFFSHTRRFSMDELIAGLTTVGAVGVSTVGGSLTVATVPTAVTSIVSAGGVAGFLGFTTTVTSIVSAPVTVPIGGVIAVGALLTYGGVKAYKLLNRQDVQNEA